MTAIDTAGMPRPSFGVGARLNDTVSIFFGRFAVFGVIGIVAGLLMELPSFLVLGADSANVAAGGDEALLAQNPALFVVISVAAPLIVYSILTAVLVLVAYDAKAGRGTNIGAAVATAFRRILPLIVMTIAAWLLIGMGFALLIVPGLWLLGVLSVFVPVIMVEGNGFGSLGRSSDLTKGYRWPIVGFIAIVYVIFYIVTLALAGLGVMVSTASPIVLLILQGVVSGVAASFVSIAVAVTYARLREIKDGVGFTDLADVFA